MALHQFPTLKKQIIFGFGLFVLMIITTNGAVIQRSEITPNNFPNNLANNFPNSFPINYENNYQNNYLASYEDDYRIHFQEEIPQHHKKDVHHFTRRMHRLLALIRFNLMLNMGLLQADPVDNY